MAIKYQPNSFTTIPNKEYLRGLDSKAQVLFMWLCVYKGDSGDCFPSRATLASDCGLSKRSIDEALKTLLSIGLITKKNRMRGKEKTTNLYSVMILGPSANSAPPSAKIDTTPRAKSAHRTQYSSNSNNIIGKSLSFYKTARELGMPQL